MSSQRSLHQSVSYPGGTEHYRRRTVETEPRMVPKTRHLRTDCVYPISEQPANDRQVRLVQEFPMSTVQLPGTESVQGQLERSVQLLGSSAATDVAYDAEDNRRGSIRNPGDSGPTLEMAPNHSSTGRQSGEVLDQASYARRIVCSLIREYDRLEDIRDQGLAPMSVESQRLLLPDRELAGVQAMFQKL